MALLYPILGYPSISWATLPSLRLPFPTMGYPTWAILPYLGPRGWITLIFSAYVGSDPASTVHPQKYQEFEAPQKNI